MQASLADPEPSPLRLQLFGPFEVFLGDLPLPRLRSRKSLWLLALLALRQGAEVERDWLAGLLWPEQTDRQALRNSLAELRRALGPEAERLRSPTFRTLSLDLSGVAVDVLAFDAAIARGDPDSLAEAVGLYRGPLLEGCTEEWVFQEREAREQAYLSALEKLAAQAMERGEEGEAAQWLRQAVDVDPLRESAQRSLMQALAARGEYAGALEVYRELRLRLHRELNAEPDAETCQLFEQIRAEARRRAQTHGGAKRWEQAPEGTRRALAGHADPDAETTAPFHGLRQNGRRRATILGERSPATHPRPAAAEKDSHSSRIAHSASLPLTPPLVGREADLERIRELLAPRASSTRLVTLTGPGGVGKTCLALRAAARLWDDFADGVCFVDLAPIRDADFFVAAAAQALGVRATSPLSPDIETRSPSIGSQPLLAALIEHLRDRELLLLIDNFEQIVAAAPVVATLVAAAARLRVLVTSRVRLHLHGEKAIPVQPLALPDACRSPSAEAIAQLPAVALFLQRARDVKPDFAVTDENAPAVAEICRRLDGLPLAIELAAARVHVLSVEQIAARLHEFFNLLDGGSRTALRATLDRSYELLTESEQVLMRRLSVFVGGWALEAAEAVCADAGSAAPRPRPRGHWTLDLKMCGRDRPPAVPASAPLAVPDPASTIQDEEVLELLTLLVEKSLLLSEGSGTAVRYRSEGSGTAVRYRFPELLRQYSRERLLESPEAAVIRDRHRDYFLRLAEQMKPQIHGCNGPWWQDRLEADRENLRAALDRVMDQQDLPTGLGWAPVLAEFWRVRGPLAEGLERLESILALPCALERSATRADTLTRMAHLAHQQGDYAAASALVKESQALHRELGAHGYVRACSVFLADLARDGGDYTKALSLYEEMAAAAPETGRERGSCLSTSLCGRGYVAYLQGELDTAQALLEEALEIDREQGYGYHVGWMLTHLAEVADACGDYPAAERLLTETLNMWQSSSHEHDIAFLLRRLGRVKHHQGDVEAAHAHFTEALALSQAREDRRGVVECLEGLAGWAAVQGQPARAACLLAAAAGQREIMTAPLPPVERGEHEGRIATVRAQLNPSAFAAAWSRGRYMPLPRAIAEALQAAPAG